MRKILAGMIAIAAVIALAVPVFAATGASKIQNQTLVSTDGTCQISLNILLHLEGDVTELFFPVPSNAKNVTVNNSSVQTHRSGNVLEVDLSNLVGGLFGDFNLIIQYSVPNTVNYNESGKLILAVPMLSGFAYPISALSFSITLPGEATASPSFSSGYFQTSIESDLTYTVNGNVISGEFTNALRDRETLVMSLEVPQEVFPQNPVEEWEADADDIGMYVCTGLAFLYWLLFLRCLPPRRIRRSMPPEGLTAGELGCALTGLGADLTMMVMSWAQMGYILIHLDENGRVILHKRMDMGNERGDFEVRSFRALFGKRQMVDGTGEAYARLYRKIAATQPNAHIWFRSCSGNSKILRVFAAGIGLFGGMSLGIAIVGKYFAPGFLVILMCVLGAFSAWKIQSGVYFLYLHNKQKLWISLVLSAVWLILGALAGEFGIAAGVVAAQLLFGAAAAYGGRRNDTGRQIVAQVFGLRRYLRTVDRAELQRICRANPEYFFSLAPYALALGVDQAFAKRFGGMRLPGCPYLTTGMDGHRTALEWSQLMRQAVSALDERQKWLPYEQLLSIRVTMGGTQGKTQTKQKTTSQSKRKRK